MVQQYPLASRPGQPAARIGPATGGARRPCVASTLCWLTDMGEINCFRSKAKSMAKGHAFCFGSGSYLSFHDCAAWSFPSGQASSRYGLPVFSSSASPCRSLQPLRPGQPAARVGPATGSGRRPCVASTLCWLTGMGEIYCFRSKAKSMAFGHAFCFGSGSYPAPRINSLQSIIIFRLFLYGFISALLRANLIGLPKSCHRFMVSNGIIVNFIIILIFHKKYFF